MLRAAGHPNAPFYPIGMVWDESLIVIEREQTRIATEANLIRQAISANLSKDGHKAYAKSIANLNVETVPLATPGEEDDEGYKAWLAEAET